MQEAEREEKLPPLRGLHSFQSLLVNNHGVRSKNSGLETCRRLVCDLNIWRDREGREGGRGDKEPAVTSLLVIMEGFDEKHLGFDVAFSTVTCTGY